MHDEHWEKEQVKIENKTVHTKKFVSRNCTKKFVSCVHTKKQHFTFCLLLSVSLS